jgi:hypothetical protein
MQEELHTKISNSKMIVFDNVKHNILIGRNINKNAEIGWFLPKNYLVLFLDVNSFNNYIIINLKNRNSFLIKLKYSFRFDKLSSWKN